MLKIMLVVLLLKLLMERLVQLMPLLLLLGLFLLVLPGIILVLLLFKMILQLLMMRLLLGMTLELLLQQLMDIDVFGSTGSIESVENYTPSSYGNDTGNAGIADTAAPSTSDLNASETGSTGCVYLLHLYRNKLESHAELLFTGKRKYLGYIKIDSCA